jgi:hypothetical protein
MKAEILINHHEQNKFRLKVMMYRIRGIIVRKSQDSKHITNQKLILYVRGIIVMKSQDLFDLMKEK